MGVLRKVTLEAAETAAEPRPETRLGRFTLEPLPDADMEARKLETGLDHEKMPDEELGSCFEGIREEVGDFLRGDLGGGLGRGGVCGVDWVDKR